MNRLITVDFDLEVSLHSGQTFLWNWIDNKFIGSFKDKIVEIRKDKKYWYWQTYPDKDDFAFIENYFRFSENYSSFIENTNDVFVKCAYEKNKHLIMLNQPFEESIISFILASNKSIKAIKRSIELLKLKQNKLIKINGEKHLFFPSVNFLEATSIADLGSTGVGYRKKYLKSLSRRFAELKAKGNYYEVQESLKSVKGIGDKIADCVVVFSLGFRNVTPIDRWSDRIISQLYRVNNLKKYEDKRNFFTNRFGENTSYAGQLLFEYIRKKDE